MTIRTLQFGAGITLLYLIVDMLSLFSADIRALLGPGGLGGLLLLPGIAACCGLLARQKWSWWLGLAAFLSLTPLGVMGGRPLASALALLMLVLLLATPYRQWE